MPQSLLPFQYEKDPTNSKLTALGGLPLYLDLLSALGMIRSLREGLDPGKVSKGWGVSDVLIALILVNLAGGDCVDDLNVLNADLGLCELMKLVRRVGYSRQQRRALQRKLAKNPVRR